MGFPIDKQGAAALLTEMSKRPEKHHVLQSPLLPCPFCGSPAALAHEDDKDVLSRMLVQCTGEGCWATMTDYQENGTPLENLTAAWNRRK